MNARPRTMPLRIEPEEAKLLLKALTTIRPTLAIPEAADNLARRVAAAIPADERAEALDTYRRST